MNENPASHSRATNWGLGLIAALLLYGLSIGPVVAWTIYTDGENHRPLRVYEPVSWCSEHIPFLGALIQYYTEWWMGLGYRLRSKAGYRI